MTLVRADDRNFHGSKAELLKLAGDLNMHNSCLLVICPNPPTEDFHNPDWKDGDYWLQVYDDLADMLEDCKVAGVDNLQEVNVPTAGFAANDRDMLWFGISKERFVQFMQAA